MKKFALIAIAFTMLFALALAPAPSTYVVALNVAHTGSDDQNFRLVNEACNGFEFFHGTEKSVAVWLHVQYGMPKNDAAALSHLASKGCNI